MTPRPSRGDGVIVTLLTDFGLGDEYAGVVKGVILGINPSARIVDLCHQVPLGDVDRAGRLLAWSWRFFPRGTVHVAVVDPGVGSSRKILCCEHRGHLFLAPDNGLLSYVLSGARGVRVYAASNRRYWLPEVSHTFHGRDIFAPLAGHLSRGLAPRRVGPPVSSIRRLAEPVPRRTGNGRWVGRVLALDRFGNAVTDLEWRGIQGWGGSGVEIRVRGRRIRGVQSAYSAVGKGKALAIVGSRGLVEIAVNGGSAARALGLKPGQRVEARRIARP